MLWFLRDIVEGKQYFCYTIVIMNIPTLHRPATRAFFFWTGITSTILYRAIIFFTDANHIVLRSIWYIGTVGFVIYFLHRYDIAKRRTRVIQELRLAEKIPQLKELSDTDRQGMQYLFETLQSSREKWNYYVIFTSSILAILAGLWIDILK